ncbi:hypothetical protein BKA70DRAFT_1437413 [Coprinopsis sp. MPI-PUGE-AT-0042]|nr:hypothetical protein BKA70DRAFT_1437413 [Coprinopsis sp. MPI-PUGE-AT-0042]
METIHGSNSDQPSESWSRQESAFLRNYPWDDTALLAGPAHDLESKFPPERVVEAPVLLDGVGGGEGQHAQEHFIQVLSYLSEPNLFTMRVNQPLIRVFLRYEAFDVLSPFGQAHGKAIRALILARTVGTGVVQCPESSTILQLHGITKGTQASNLLCRYMSLLRVIDVASALEGRQRSPKISKWGHPWNPAMNPALSLLADVKPLLMKAKHALQTLSQAEDSLSTQSLDTPHRIMKELARSMTKTKGCHIVNNILLASLHLSWLLSGKSDVPETFSRGPVSSATQTEAERTELSTGNADTPETSQGIVDLAALTEAEKEELSTLLSDADSPSKIRFPLVYSLFVSPLLLLRTLSAWKKSMDRLHLLTAAIYMGNDRPPAIAKTEQAIFSVIFGIAKGAMTPRGGVQHLIDSVPWESISNLPAEVSKWFVLPANPPLAPPNPPNGIVLSFPHANDSATASGGCLIPSTPANTGSASPHSLDPLPFFGRLASEAVPAVGSLHEFAMRFQSAAIAANMQRTLAQPLALTATFAALGLHIDESTIQQLISGLPPSNNATITPSPVPLALCDVGQERPPACSTSRPSTPSIPSVEISMQQVATTSAISSPVSSRSSTPSVPDDEVQKAAALAAPMMPSAPSSQSENHRRSEDISSDEDMEDSDGRDQDQEDSDSRGKGKEDSDRSDQEQESSGRSDDDEEGSDSSGEDQESPDRSDDDKEGSDRSDEEQEDSDRSDEEQENSDRSDEEQESPAIRSSSPESEERNSQSEEANSDRSFPYWFACSAQTRLKRVSPEDDSSESKDKEKPCLKEARTGSELLPSTTDNVHLMAASRVDLGGFP